MEENLHRQRDVDAEKKMRYAINALKDRVKNLTRQLERSKQKGEETKRELIDKRREMKRWRNRSEWLQKRCDDLIDFIKEKGLKPPFEKYESDKE